MYIWGKLVPASICRGSACRGYSSHVWGQNEEKTKFLWIFLEQWRRQLCSRYPELRISQQLLRASSTKSVLTHNVLRIFQNILCNPPALFPFSSSLCFFFNWSRVDTVLLCQILQLSPLKFIKFHLCSLPDSKDLCRRCWLVLQLQCCLPAASGHWQCGYVHSTFLLSFSFYGKCRKFEASYFKWRPARDRPIYVCKCYIWYQLSNGKRIDCLLEGAEKIAHCTGKKQIILMDVEISPCHVIGEKR